MNNKMHVLVIPSWYPLGEDKLMGQYHKEFTEALNKDKDIIANMIYIERERIRNPLNYIKKKKYETIVETNYVTLVHRTLNLDPVSTSLMLKNYTHALISTFKKYIKLYGKPDVIHAEVTIPAGYAACRLGKKFNIPVVVTEHASYIDRFFEGKYLKYSKYVVNNSIYSTVSAEMNKKIKNFNVKPLLLPNQVNTELFRKAKPKKKDNTLDLVQVCALRRTKRTDLIMDAMQILIDKYAYKKIHLTVVGDGFESNLFKKICTEKNMNKYVTFVGRKEKNEIYKYYEKADISVIASDYETFAIPAIESLATGTPVISTRCGGPEGYLDDKCSRFCEILNPESMAKAIDNMYKNLDNIDLEYLKEKAEQFNEKNIIETAKNIYKKAMK